MSTKTPKDTSTIAQTEASPTESSDVVESTLSVEHTSEEAKAALEAVSTTTLTPAKPRRLRLRFRPRPRGNKPTKKRRRLLRRRPLKPPTDFRKELYAIPNLLTYFRILMIPLILLIVDRDSRWHSFMAASLFTIACATDFFDGYLARRLNQITILGKLLDPLADKLIVSSILIIMIPMGRAPSWIVILLIAREFTITGLRGIAASERMVIASASLGKYKTAFQMLSLFCLLVHYSFRIDFFGLMALQVSFHHMGLAFLYISLFYSIASAIDYFWKFASQINEQYKDTGEPQISENT